MPVEVARRLSEGNHEVWTAYEAGLAEASDQELIVYADARGAIAVTINKDFVPVARRLRMASVVYLRVREPDALRAMQRAVDWLESNVLPHGMVLRVPLHADIHVMAPIRW